MTDRPSVSKRARATKPTRRTDTRGRVTKASARLTDKPAEAEVAVAAAVPEPEPERALVVRPAELAAEPEPESADITVAFDKIPDETAVPAAEESPAQPVFEEEPSSVGAPAPGEAPEPEEPAASGEPSGSEELSEEEPVAEPAGESAPSRVYRAPSPEDFEGDSGTWTVSTPEEVRQELLAEQRMAEIRRARTAGAVFKAIAFFIIFMVVVVVGFLSWERWYAHDDIADIQGTWNIQGEAGVGHPDVNIKITDTKIILDINTTYTYTLDTAKKTITYRFQNLEGEGHYRFSADRRYILITDGHYTWIETCLMDFAWQLESWKANFYGTAQPELGDLEGATLLYRVY